MVVICGISMAIILILVFFGVKVEPMTEEGSITANETTALGTVNEATEYWQSQYFWGGIGGLALVLAVVIFRDSMGSKISREKARARRDFKRIILTVTERD